jgi:hypothetical protein
MRLFYGSCSGTKMNRSQVGKKKLAYIDVECPHCFTSWISHSKEDQETCVHCERPLKKATPPKPIQYESQVIEAFPDLPTLKEIKFEAILERLSIFNGSRTKSAKSLGISTRAINLWLLEMKSLGMQVPEMGQYNADL